VDSAHGSSGVLRGFRLSLAAQGLRPKTIEGYTRDASRFAAKMGGRLGCIQSSDFIAYIADYHTDHAPKSVREAQIALRRFLRFLVTEGELETDPTANLKLINVRPEPQPTYSEAEIKRLLTVSGQRSPDGIRNRALILTLFDTGVRVSELVSMSEPDFDRATVRVEGKTGVRGVPLGMATLQAIERYVRRWRIQDGPLWRGKRGPLTRSGVLQIIRRLCSLAGVDHKGVHAFRRAAAAQMKRLGMNDSDILEVMGWRSIEMLRRYTASVAEELAQEAHRKFSPADALAGR